MRTVVIILVGFAFWAMCVAVGRFLSKSKPVSDLKSTFVFAGLWLVIAAANMWVGITEAGYSFMEELPIFLAIFLLPVVVGTFVSKKLLKSGAGEA